MKLLVCGEGPGDIGRTEWDINARQHVAHDGWLQGLLRTLLGPEPEFVTKARREVIILPRDAKNFRPLPHGHGVKALAAKLLAKAQGCDAVVYMLDTDSTDEKRWREIRDEVSAGFDEVTGIPAVACIPMSASESWLVSDANAWKALGLSASYSLHSKPEELWGARNDPDGGHPHQYFARICKEADVPDNPDTRRQLGLLLSPAELQAKCPISFRPFQDQVLALLPA